MVVSLAEANKIVAGAIAKAEELNIKINVAVCDAGGRLIAFNRMDGPSGPGFTVLRARRWLRRPSGGPAASCRNAPTSQRPAESPLPRADT